MKPIKCIVIDDEELDRLMVCTLIKKYASLTILAEHASAEEALESKLYLDADVLFIDIDMGLINGLTFREMAKMVPACIFITSHPEFAIDSYALDTLDYIMKPLTLNRFKDTVIRIEDFFEIREKLNVFENHFQGGFIFIKEGSQETKVQLHEILYLEALKDYTRIVTTKKMHYILSNLGNLLKQKEFETFIRIHRSFAVRKDIIISYNQKNVILQNNIELPIGRNFKDNLKSINPVN